MRLVLLIAVAATLGWSAPPLSPNIPSAAQTSSHFNVDAATSAWLATFPATQKRRSDAYFEGGYWLMAIDFVWLAAVMVLLLETRLSAWMRDRSEGLSARRPIQSWLYWIQFCIAAAVLMLPLTLYEGFFRERSYGLMNQNFGGWFRDQSLAFAVIGLLLGGLAFVLFSTILRRLLRSWPIWGTAAATLMIMFASFIEPVFLAPLFNTYKPLQNGRMKDSILSLARASGIAANEVYEENASKQSKRISAFVSGFGATERITLNDNLLNRVSPEGVLSVMGHEMGHYVMHHIADAILFSLLALAAMFTILSRLMEQAVSWYGGRWRVRTVSDVALLPFAVLMLAVLNFLFTPVGNTFTRTQEYEADLYGLNAARQPDGEAEVDVLLGEYRKLDPGPVEEFLFYDHPSGRTRIHAAMRWKAENLCLFDPKLPCGTQTSSVTASPNRRFAPSGTARQ